MYLYVATDGRFSKIGISRDPTTRKPKPIRFADDGGKAAQVRIVKSWHRPHDAAKLEAAFRDYYIHRRIAGFEWFDIAVDILTLSVEREIWYADEFPKDKSARCPIPLSDVWVGHLDLPTIPACVSDWRGRGGKPGRASVINDKNAPQIIKALNNGETFAATARAAKISVQTIKNHFELAGRPKVWRRKKAK